MLSTTGKLGLPRLRRCSHTNMLGRGDILREKRLLKCREALLPDRGARVFQEAKDETQVVEGSEAIVEQFPAAAKMVQVGGAVLYTGGAIASRINGRFLGADTRPCEC